MFIISMSVAIGIGLKQVNKASKSMSDEKFMFQTSILLEDILHILKSSKELDMIKTLSSDAEKIEVFATFLHMPIPPIPFDNSDMLVSIEFNSARSKFNINSLENNESNITQLEQLEHFKRYMTWKKVGQEYTDILLDAKGGLKEDFNYRSDLFSNNSHLIRKSISSLAHLKEINKFYLNSSHNVRINDIDGENLFDFSNDDDYKIDLNHATKETFEFLLACDELRAEQLVAEAGEYSNVGDMLLSPKEKENLEKFETSYYEPFIDVTIEFEENNNKAIIRFQYDIEEKKGSNFVYEI